MADNTELTAGSGGDTIATDDIAGVKHQRVKVQYGDDGSATDVSDTNPLPVDDAGGSLSVDDGGTSLTVDGTVAATQSGTWTVQPGNTANTTAWKVDGSAVTQPVSGTVTVQDGGGAISIDDNGSTVSIDDGGGSVTVDGSVSVSGAVDTELTTADLDTGAGTDTRAVVGIALAASGGAVLAGSANPVPVSDNSGSLTVDNAGTFAVQAAQSGTWTVQPGNTANTTAWKVDGSAVTQPVSGTGLGVVGAAAADAPVSGNPVLLAGYGSTATPTAMSADGDTTRVWTTLNGAVNVADAGGSLTVDYATTGSGTATGALRVELPTNGTGVVGLNAGSNTVGNIGTVTTSVTPGTSAAHLGKAEDAAHASGDTGVMALSVRQNTAAATSGTDGDYQPLITDTNGRLHVIDVNNQANTGVVTATTQRVTLATDIGLPTGSNTIGSIANIGTSVTPGTGATNLGKAEDAAHTTGDVGVMALAVRSDTAASTAGTTGDYQPLITNATGAVWAQLNPGTSGGATLSSTISAASTNATNVKGSAGVVYSIDLSNANASARWFKMYNKATSPTVGTDTPVFRAMIPASGGRTISFPHGLTFGTGIGFALTTGAADSDTGAVAANELTVNLGYA